jgi:hypothetical protein
MDGSAEDLWAQRLRRGAAIFLTVVAPSTPRVVATRIGVVTSAPSLSGVDSNSMVGIGAEAVPYTAVLAVVEEAVSD